MDDFISRQKAVDAVFLRFANKQTAVGAVYSVPSEKNVVRVVFCKDCRFAEEQDDGRILLCNTWNSWNVPKDCYCAFGAVK